MCNSDTDEPISDPRCVSRAVLEHSTGRWGALVLVSLTDGPTRFAGVRRSVTGISDRMLAQTLQRLESHGLVSRTTYDRGNSRVEYSLTTIGAPIAEQLVVLVAVIEQQLPAIHAHRVGAGPGQHSVPLIPGS
ncbi:helix-turn-helix transcriptional regulator [Curtobacterium albidum]|uniref:Helix-turn-helix transcriptional regulator n=1 Tax=Curtobacterium citreum TaxID=2036 RepID=A0A850DXQ5_9MICO|nr:helix-turn-helix domain-containing protein [Curtobacterium albidum]NUU29205.1 helix-turn-helix transcriptional regulator [Curtobacterium albidum]